MDLRQKLANDNSFRALVRAVVSYLNDPDQWDQEVNHVIENIVPRQHVDNFHVDNFKEIILKKVPGIESVSEYFQTVGPKNKLQLEKRVDSVYNGIFKPVVQTEKVIKEPDWYKDYLNPPKEHYVNFGPVRDKLQEIRQESGRPVLPRIASRVVLAYLDSIK